MAYVYVVYLRNERLQDGSPCFAGAWTSYATALEWCGGDLEKYAIAQISMG